jgi:uncharacterized integral membrane protein
VTDVPSEPETPPRADDPARPPAALATDLREVRTRPERAFNAGAALGLTLATAAFIFIVQNGQPTDFDWLWFDFTLPLLIALLGALVVGALLVVAALAVHRRRRRRIARREQAAARLEDALTGERTPRGPGEPTSDLGVDEGDALEQSRAVPPPD